MVWAASWLFGVIGAPIVGCLLGVEDGAMIPDRLSAVRREGKDFACLAKGWGGHVPVYGCNVAMHVCVCVCVMRCHVYEVARAKRTSRVHIQIVLCTVHNYLGF